MNMRSRTNTTIRRKNAAEASASSICTRNSSDDTFANAKTSMANGSGTALSDSFFEEVENDDCNGKLKAGAPQKLAGQSSFIGVNGSHHAGPPPSLPQTPSKASFNMPPPPKMTSLAFNAKTSPATTKVSPDDNKSTKSPPRGMNGHGKTDLLMSEKDSCLVDNDNAASTTSHSLQANLTMPIPPPPSGTISTTIAYQRSKTSVNNATSEAKVEETTVATSGDVQKKKSRNIENTTSTARVSAHSSYNSYNNPAYNPTQPSISHPYKPSHWYKNARERQRRRKRIKQFLGFSAALILGTFLWRALKHLKIILQEEMERHNSVHHHHHHEYHKHHPGHLHAMTGLVESPLGFATIEKPMSPQNEMNSAEISGIDHNKDNTIIELKPAQEQHPRSNNNAVALAKSFPEGIKHAHETFYSFPVATLSNNRLLPYIGFGVASRSVEHKQIPTIVATLLQYASAETEGGGGIALIDAVIDEEKDADFNDELEANMAKTVITLVGRAINYFGKETAKRRAEETKANNGGSAFSGLLRSSGKKYIDGGETSKSFDDEFSEGYDYDHRLEVHLLIGISSSDLGGGDTVKSLRNVVVELDGLVPSIPHGDLVNKDVSDWNIETPTVPAVDRHIDVRLQVLLHAPHCSKGPTTVPCSPHDSGHKMTLDKWVESWEILKKMYDAKIIHGIGLDSATAGDLHYLFEHSDIVPLMYRGDISKAVDGYGRRMGNRMPGVEDGVASMLKEKGVTYLANNVAGHILERKDTAPNAYALLQMLGEVIFRAHHQLMPDHNLVTAARKGSSEYYTVPRLVLSYLIRHGVCALPHAYKPEHLADDAPESVGGLASLLTERRVAEIGVALEALLSGNDLPEDHGLGGEGEDASAVVFHNESGEEVRLVQIVEDSDVGYGEKEEPIPFEKGGYVSAGDSVVIIAKTGDKFSAYGSENGEKLGSFEVQSTNGGADDFTISTSSSE
mmetsp:Transcript_9453/g.19594  ORF Transcript_9453/g.19594 Transcript_9453/m.19594 type:complete len:962 (+) Transcript_9453:57-2942(+)